MLNGLTHPSYTFRSYGHFVADSDIKAGRIFLPGQKINMRSERNLLGAFRSNPYVHGGSKVTETTVFATMTWLQEICYSKTDASAYAGEIQKCCNDIFSLPTRVTKFHPSDLSQSDLYMAIIYTQEKNRHSNYLPHTIRMAVGRYIRGDFGPVKDDNGNKQGIFAGSDQFVYPIRTILTTYRTGRNAQRNVPVRSSTNQDTGTPIRRRRAPYALRNDRRILWRRGKEKRLIRSPFKKYPK